MKILITLQLLRLVVMVTRTPLPDWPDDTTSSYRIRAIIARVTLQINGFEVCVLSDGSRGWKRGIENYDMEIGPVGYAMNRIHQGMPDTL